MKAKLHREQFISLWIILVLLLALLMALVLFPPDDAFAQDDDPQTDAAAIQTLAAEMQAAVLSGDDAAYLALVDFSDPVFAREHRYWVTDWTGPGAVEVFELTLDDLAMEDNDATAIMHLHWKLAGDYLSQFAEYPVRFTQDGTGIWHFAGEAWTTIENGRFMVHAAPGAVDAAQPIADALPDIFASVTGSLDHAPDGTIQIKLYDDMSDLTASVALSMPGMRGWNEPGEGIKLFIRQRDNAEDWSSVLAHELTHYVTFDMAGTTRGNYPWWLAEGIAVYASTPYWDDTEIVRWWDSIAQMVVSGQLAEWDAMTIFEDTPRELWGQVYPQGYAMVSYVTEIEGQEARNTWLAAMGSGESLEAATETTFGKSFSALDADFRTWLAARITAE